MKRRRNLGKGKQGRTAEAPLHFNLPPNGGAFEENCDEELQQHVRSVVWQKEDRHHIGEPEFQQPERSMSCIGG